MTIYLDHNATAIPAPAAIAAATHWLARPANPSSVHGPGRAARAAVEKARRQLAGAFGGVSAGFVFTSGATEALHLALNRVKRGAHVVASAVEHPAVFGACATRGVEVTRVGVDARGGLTVDDVVAACRPDTALVVVMRAQNELGTLYPVSAIARAVAPIPVLCDCAQAAGRIPLDVATLGASMVTLSGHKIGAPPGVGALYVTPGEVFDPLIAGGPQERGRRAGTENVAGIVAMGVAASLVPDRVASMAGVAARRDRLLHGLQAALPEIVIHGEPTAGLPNTASFRVPGVDGDVLLAALDMQGVFISTGSACASGGVEPSPVLIAIGLDDRQARAGLRISLGPETTDGDIAEVLRIFPEVARRALAGRREAS